MRRAAYCLSALSIQRLVDYASEMHHENQCVLYSGAAVFQRVHGHNSYAGLDAYTVERT